MSDDAEDQSRWRTRPTRLRWRRHGLAGGIAAGLLLAGGGVGYAAGTASGDDPRTPVVEQVGQGGPVGEVEGGLPDGPPPGVPAEIPSREAEVLPQT